MIDGIKISTPVSFFPSDEVKPKFIKIGALKLIAIENLKSFEIMKYQCEHKNLLFTLNERELIIANSLHKFIKGNNYSDFSLSELIHAVNEIERITEIPASLFFIKKLEFSLNISVSLAPSEYLNWFSDFKGKEYDRMKANQLWYGIKYFFTEYSLKIYDKQRQVRIADRVDIHQKLLRFEVVYNRQRKLSVINRLSELREPVKVKEIFSDFIKMIEKLNCTGNEDFSKLRNGDRELYFAAKDPKYWKALKSHNIHTCKTNKKRFKEIQNRINPKDMTLDFVNSLTIKFNQLIEC